MEGLSRTILGRSVVRQMELIAIVWIVLFLAIQISPLQWDPKLSIATFFAVPAVVLAVWQLFINAHVQRAAYIKDYALRFRTDKELSESFYYLIYKYGNTDYKVFKTPVKKRTRAQDKELKAADNAHSSDLRFFDPELIVGSPQERRLDNLLGFFDTIGYDFRRGLLDMRDIAGVFGTQLDHLRQRETVEAYLSFVTKRWPDTTFYKTFNAPIPFGYLRLLISAYAKYRDDANERAKKDMEKNT